MNEIWKDVIWYEWLYQISNKWNLCRWWKKLKKSKCSNWYLFYTLCSKSIRKMLLIHRLVAIHFIDNTESKPQVNHIDGDSENNDVENLEWVTPSENMIHSYKILKRCWVNKWRFWKNHHRSRKINQLDLEWNIINSWDSIRDVKRTLWINDWNISDCCRWVRKWCWGFKWEYNLTI